MDLLSAAALNLAGGVALPVRAAGQSLNPIPGG